VKWFANSPFGILVGIALVCLVLFGSCSYAEGACANSGGNWDGNNFSCTHGGSK
jgi:hypothetical protein